MSKPIFIDVDAQWLYDQGQRMMEDDDSDLLTALRICKIAERLERMNARDMELLAKGEFAAGVMDAYARIYQRSNLPDEALPVAMKNVRPKVAPVGATSKTIAKVEKKLAEEKRVLAKLSGIKLNLSNFGKRKEDAE
jgi:hypothetical protein